MSKSLVPAVRAVIRSSETHAEALSVIQQDGTRLADVTHPPGKPDGIPGLPDISITRAGGEWQGDVLRVSSQAGQNHGILPGSAGRGARMKKSIHLIIDDEDLLELMRILMDEDEPGALAFLKRHFKGKARDLLEGG